MYTPFPLSRICSHPKGWTRFSEWKDLDSMSEEEWDKCWNANVKVPKALLTEAKKTFDNNPDGGQMITTGSVAVCIFVHSNYFSSPILLDAFDDHETNQ
jgi:hypothetical protein